MRRGRAGWERYDKEIIFSEEKITRKSISSEEKNEENYTVHFYINNLSR